MFLQKTGSRIKHLISSRRRSDSDESSSNQIVLAFDKTQSVNIPRRVSWRVSETSFTEHTPLQPGNRNEGTRNLLCSITNESASSSASSLCSCGCEVKPSTAQYSLSTTELAPNQVESLYIRPLSLPTPRRDPKPWKSANLNSSLRSSSLKPSRTDEFTTNREPSDSNSTFDLPEALFLELEHINSNSAQAMENIEANTENLSDDVDQLIWETDQAFKAVGTALAEAKNSTRSWYDCPDVDSTNTYAIPPTKTPSIPARGTARRQPAVPRPVIVSSKAKRRTSVVVKKKKGGLMSKAFRSAPADPTNTPRWTLTDMTTNMVDALSGRMFQAEVNELFPSKTFQQFREVHHEEIERRTSSETLHTDDTNASDTPSEPFHLEDLSSRLGDLYPPEPILPPPAVPGFDKRPKSKIYGPCGESIHMDDLRFPSSPQRPITSYSPRSGNSISSLTLPAIPEISPFQTPITSAPRVIDFSDTVDLPSTKYTLTSPYFQHGPIRFSRSDLEDKRSRYAREKRYTPLHQMWEENEPLDWTAFQIAILGAVDEDLENMDNLNMKDDMWDWWEELGVGGPGRLLKNFETPESSTERDSEEEDLTISSGIFERENDIVQTDDVDIDAPILAHKDIFAAGLEVDTRYSFPSSPSTDHHAIKAMQAQFDFRCKQQENTPDSLPPSPMFDLVMTHGEEGKATVMEEIVPMGFNLGHDLGDFLEWEAKYRHIAYADGEEDNLYEA